MRLDDPRNRQVERAELGQHLEDRGRPGPVELLARGVGHAQRGGRVPSCIEGEAAQCFIEGHASSLPTCGPLRRSAADFPRPSGPIERTSQMLAAVWVGCPIEVATGFHAATKVLFAASAWASDCWARVNSALCGAGLVQPPTL